LWINNRWQYDDEILPEYFFDDSWDLPNLDDGMINLPSHILTQDPSTHDIFIQPPTNPETPDTPNDPTPLIPTITQTQESPQTNHTTSPTYSPLHTNHTPQLNTRNIADLQSALATQVTPIPHHTQTPKRQRTAKHKTPTKTQ